MCKDLFDHGLSLVLFTYISFVMELIMNQIEILREILITVAGFVLVSIILMIIAIPFVL